jgi:hypothetical protein
MASTVLELVRSSGSSILRNKFTCPRYGIDGNWSAVGLSIGEPGQRVDVIVSTGLSEIWVIENNGCGASKAILT